MIPLDEKRPEHTMYGMRFVVSLSTSMVTSSQRIVVIAGRGEAKLNYNNAGRSFRAGTAEQAMYDGQRRCV
jgi:hypothetical protein